MSYCRICGAEGYEENGVKWFPFKHNTLCASCADDTPNKVSREEFDATYWLGEDGQIDQTIMHSTKREFYDDYKSSNLTLEQYIARTTSAI